MPSLPKAFRNGRIFTATGSPDLVDFLVIRDGIVKYNGSEQGYATSSMFSRDVLAGARDLDRAVVLPGIIDAHSHLEMMGDDLARLNLRKCTSVVEIQSALTRYRAAHPDALRILGTSWLFDVFDGANQPTREIIDAVISDVPVYLDANDKHSCWLNSAALEELGVDKFTVDPRGGKFVRDKEGDLTGFVLETAYTEYVWPFLARQTTHAQRIARFEATFKAYLATGVTGAVDMACDDDHLLALEEIFHRSDRTLPLRMSVHYLITVQGSTQDRRERVQRAIDHRKRIAELGLGPWLQVAGIKVIADGVIDACTAFMKEPYFNGQTAEPIWKIEDLQPVVTQADAAGLQIAIHAIGDAASEMALDALAAAVTANGPNPNRRHRLEHLESITEESISRMAKAGVIASIQPVHSDPFINFNWMTQLGHDHRCGRAFPWSDMVQAGVDIAIGTDSPTAPYEPLPNLYVATTRRSALDPDMEWPPKGPSAPHFIHNLRYKLELKTALEAATRGAAFSCRMEKVIGSLAVGMAADFAILGVDPFEDGLGVLARAQAGVDETWVAGRQVFVRTV